MIAGVLRHNAISEVPFWRLKRPFSFVLLDQEYHRNLSSTLGLKVTDIRRAQHTLYLLPLLSLLVLIMVSHKTLLYIGLGVFRIFRFGFSKCSCTNSLDIKQLEI